MMKMNYLVLWLPTSVRLSTIHFREIKMSHQLECLFEIHLWEFLDYMIRDRLEGISADCSEGKWIADSKSKCTRLKKRPKFIILRQWGSGTI